MNEEQSSGRLGFLEGRERKGMRRMERVKKRKGWIQDEEKRNKDEGMRKSRTKFEDYCKTSNNCPGCLFFNLAFFSKGAFIKDLTGGGRFFNHLRKGGRLLEEERGVYKEWAIILEALQ